MGIIIVYMEVNNRQILEQQLLRIFIVRAKFCGNLRRPVKETMGITLYIKNILISNRIFNQARSHNRQLVEKYLMQVRNSVHGKRKLC